MVEKRPRETIWHKPENLVKRTMVGVAILVGTGFVAAILYGDGRLLEQMMVATIIYALGFMLTGRYLRQKRLLAASQAVIACIWIANTTVLFVAGSIRLGQGYIYVIILTLSAILLGTRSTFIVGGASIAAVVVGFSLERNGIMDWAVAGTSVWLDLGVLITTLAVATHILQFVVTMMSESFAASQRNHEIMMAEQKRLMKQIMKRRQSEVSLQEANEALEAAHEIARSSHRNQALFFGGVDMSADLRCSNSWQALLYARSRVVHAAATYGLDVLDVPFLDLDDAEGMLWEAEQAKDIGYTGKGAIHPKQIAALNEVFTPDEATVAHARKIMDAFAANDSGLLVVDGKLYEKPVLRTLARILAIHERVS